MRKRILTWAMTLILCLGLLPVAALAVEFDPADFDTPIISDLTVEKRQDGCGNLVFQVQHPNSILEAFFWYMDNGLAEGLMVGKIRDPDAQIRFNISNWNDATVYCSGGADILPDGGECYIVTDIPYEDLISYPVQVRLYYTGYYHDPNSGNAWGIVDWFGDKMGKFSNVLTLEPLQASAFSDVPRDAWYAVYVNEAVELGLLKGKGEGLFAPNDNMTVAEAITLASRMDTLLKGKEVDVGEGYDGNGPWYQPYVNYAWTVGLPWEYENYNAKITRDEFARIFAAVYKNNKAVYDAEGIVPVNQVRDGAIPDVPMSHPYANDIYTLYRLGVLGGSDSARSFLPDSNIKRSEVAAIVMRMGDPTYLQHFTLE